MQVLSRFLKLRRLGPLFSDYTSTFTLNRSKRGLIVEEYLELLDPKGLLNAHGTMSNTPSRVHTWDKTGRGMVGLASRLCQLIIA